MKTLSILSLLLGLSTIGCATTPALYDGVAHSASAARPADAVEVLLDSAPARPFQVTGDISTSGLESTRSIDRMRQMAAQNGLDGIYWIACEGGSGRCSAKGFVYTETEGTLMATVASR